MLCDSSMRLRNPPIDVKKYQQAFLSLLPGKATGIEFIRLNLLARLFLVILSSLSFFLISCHYPPQPWAISPFVFFSTPSATNVATGPNVINGDANFELKPALITMVLASPFCGKAHKDANGHMQHFLEICSTFTLRE